MLLNLIYVNQISIYAEKMEDIIAADKNIQFILQKLILEICLFYFHVMHIL